MPQMMEEDWGRFPGLGFALPFEASFNAHYHRAWFAANWTVSVAIALLYVFGVFLGSSLMKSRQPYSLRKALTVWSASLALFSFVGSLRMIPELLSVLSNRGFLASFCDNSYVNDLRIQFWIWLFIWSKVLEVGDTVFVVLRKQKMLFLHWYHHALTLVYCFFAFAEMASAFRWFASMNYVVHTIMYSYYALKAQRVRVPRIVALIITTLQILQMIMGLIICGFSVALKGMGNTCSISFQVASFGLVIYLTFLVLFANFFVKSYLVKPKSRAADPYDAREKGQ